MRTRAWLLLSLVVVVLALPVAASPYEIALCPITSGRFLLIEGKLWLEVLKQDGKPVKTRREPVANPRDERSHEVLSHRGTVTVELHRDKKSGGVFVHWGTLKDGDK